MKFRFFPKSRKPLPPTNRKELEVTQFRLGYNELFGEVRVLINNSYLIVTKVEYAKTPENPLLGFQGIPMPVEGRPIAPCEKPLDEVQGKDISPADRWNYGLDDDDLSAFYEGETEKLALSFSDTHYQSYFTREYWHVALSSGFGSNKGKASKQRTAVTQQQPLISPAD